MSPSTCPNCQQEAMGAYCHHCGQKQGIQRLSWRYLFEDLQQRLFGFDNNYLRTFRDLTIRPGKVVHTIIEGIRVKYVGPIGYYFLMLTIYLLLTSFLDIDFSELAKPLVQEADSEFEKNFQNSIFSTIFGNFRVTSFVMAPFFILGVWLLFRKKKYNFLETSVLYFYSQGHIMILSIITVLIYYFSGSAEAMTYTLIPSIIYFGFVCASFYEGNAVWNFVKSLLGFLLGYIILLFVFLIGFIIYLFLNPEIVQQIQQESGG